MPTLRTPRQVIQQAYLAASAATDTPDAGMQLLQQITDSLRQRGMLDIAMSMQSVEDLLEETADRLFEAQAAEARHVASFESH